MQSIETAVKNQTYFRLSEIATSPAKPAREYTDPQGKVRNIKAKPAHKGVTPLGASTILKWCKDGRFPKPLRHLKGVTLWKAADVYQWLASLEVAANDEGN
jgi:predicted DNA-binding transcriptional regulator AlpA